METDASTLYAGVVVEAPLTRVFHYRVPDRLATAIRPGDRAVVPFARRRARGVVVSLTRVPPIDPALIKELVDISAPEERVPDDILELTRWAASYYRSGWGTLLATAVPAGVKQGRRERPARILTLNLDPEAARSRAEAMAARSPKQAEALRAIAAWRAGNPGRALAADNPEIRAAAPASVLRPLAEKGLISVRDALPEAPEPFPEAAREIVLSPEQEAAVQRILPHVEGGGFQSFLLHGVTGSGKTEVYMRLIAAALAAGRGALVLVPEISLTPQTVSRFRRRFGELAVLHSNLADGERAGHWRRLRTGEIRLAVGARSAVFAPVADLGLVVVDEEHERSYKQDNDPRYHARDVAIMRAHLAGAVAVLGSATPGMESWWNARTGKHVLVDLPTRVGGALPPRVETVDLRREWADVKRPTLLSRRLEQAITECLQRREQAILFLNRRGFHTSVRCAVCGEAVECEHCDVAMTHHRAARLLRCGCCGAERGVPETCPNCGGKSLKFFGAGTERAEDVLAGLFPRARMLRMDSDSMAARDAHRRSLAAFARGEYDILLGTQMIAKGLDFPNVTLVGVLMADAALGMSDFRAGERTFQLITQVVGRAGRARKPGLAVVQAFMPEHPAVACAVAQDYRSFVETELADRRSRGYPPFARMARVVLSGEREESVRELAAGAGAALRSALPEACRMLGPSACEVERRKGLFQHHILLFAPEAGALAAWLLAAGVKPGVERGVRLAVDIDPVTMQ